MTETEKSLLLFLLVVVVVLFPLWSYFCLVSAMVIFAPKLAVVVFSGLDIVVIAIVVVSVLVGVDISKNNDHSKNKMTTQNAQSYFHKQNQKTVTKQWQ